MIIKKVNIGSFGKLKNLYIELIDGFNVIYGENEAGKSTLQAFIKAMLYGMNSQKHSIRENDRRRFLPWGEGSASGELYFEDDDGNEYMIKRSFGLMKRHDDSVVLNSISGTRVDKFDFYMPGIDIVGLGEEAFEKTIFIRQLGCTVKRDKEDEVMKRLTNLQQSGDENVSYHKALEAMSQALKSLENIRKTGKLDLLRKNYSELQEEWQQLTRLHMQNIEDQMKLNNLIEEKAHLQERIINIEEQRELLKKDKLHKEYEELLKYLHEINERQKEFENIDSDLKRGEVILDESWIEKIKKDYFEWRQLRNKSIEMYEKKEEVQTNLEKKQLELEDYSGFHNLDENIEDQIIDRDYRIKEMENKLKEIEIQQQEITSLELQLNKERSCLGSLVKFEEVTSEMEEDICNREEQLQELKHKIMENYRTDSFTLRRDILKDKRKNSWFMLLTGVFFLLSGIIAGWAVNSYAVVLAAAGLLLSIWGAKKKNKIQAEIQEIEEKIRSMADVEKIQQNIIRIEETLEQTYRRLGVSGYQEFIIQLRKFNENKNTIATLKTKLEEKKQQLEKWDIEQLKERLKEDKKAIEEILELCSCSSIDAFKKELKLYEKKIIEKENVEKEIIKVNQDLSEFEELLQSKEKKLKKDLQSYYGEQVPVDRFEKIIHELSEKIKKKKEFELEIKSLQNTYHALLKDRNIDEIREELEGIVPLEWSEEIQVEEELELLLKNKNEIRIELEKSIKDIENKITNRFNGKRSIVEVEEEMGNIRERIRYYEGISKSIFMASEVIKDSFKEIQRCFGPKLNSTVGGILNKITLGKYQELKISENFEVMVTDPVQDQVMDIDYFSNGTWDQIYFSLRMGMKELIFEGRRSIPIVLDDTFVQYDDERVTAVLEYLYEYSRKHQVILFTCQNREVEILKELGKFHLIRLSV